MAPVRTAAAARRPAARRARGCIGRSRRPSRSAGLHGGGDASAASGRCTRTSASSRSSARARAGRCRSSTATSGTSSSRPGSSRAAPGRSSPTTLRRATPTGSTATRGASRPSCSGAIPTGSRGGWRTRTSAAATRTPQTGESFDGDYDQRHTLNGLREPAALVARHRGREVPRRFEHPGPRLLLTDRPRGRDGLPTFALGPARNVGRLPPYSRLDLSVRSGLQLLDPPAHACSSRLINVTSRVNAGLSGGRSIEKLLPLVPARRVPVRVLSTRWQKPAGRFHTAEPPPGPPPLTRADAAAHTGTPARPPDDQS